MTSIAIRSYAKLNIALDVLDQRPDGYHNIESVIQTISLCDHMVITKRAHGELTVTVSNPIVPSGERNLAYRACVLFLEAAGLTDGVDIRIEKNIPMQAGLGGGSSNAAATVTALNELFDRPLSDSDMLRICTSLGSDVPFFLAGGTAFVEGRGELVTELPGCPLDFIVVKPDFGISTAWAYGRFGEDRTSRHYSRTAAQACRNGDRTSLIKSMGNDFNQIAEDAYPEIADIRQRLLDWGADGALLAGSGSAVFGAFLDPMTCDRAYAKLRDEHKQVFRARTILRREFHSSEQ